MNTRIKAFTLMEVVISMIIAALVITIAYTAYQIIHRSYQAYQLKNTQMAVLLRLDERLKKDFSRSVLISQTTEGLAFTDSSGTVRYTFSEGSVIRQGILVDTFKVITQDISLQFEGKALAAAAEEEPESNRIDELSFNGLYADEIIPYHYHKQYSSENLIERNPDAIH
jgi:prepilin-type N-terminal cleavage/methylation domain-containing protein